MVRCLLVLDVAMDWKESCLLARKESKNDILSYTLYVIVSKKEFDVNGVNYASIMPQLFQFLLCHVQILDAIYIYIYVLFNVLLLSWI